MPWVVIFLPTAYFHNESVPNTKPNPNISDIITPKVIASWLNTPANPRKDIGAISDKYNGAATVKMPTKYIIYYNVFLTIFFSVHTSFSFPGLAWSWPYGSWIYNYLCNQCLPLLKLWVSTPFMTKCTQYNILQSSLSVTCGGFLRVLRFLHQ